MVVSKENMVVFIGVLLFSMNIVEIASAIRSFSEGPLEDDLNVIYSPIDPIELHEDANQYARGNKPINQYCKSLQDCQYRIHGDEVRTIVVDTSKKIKGDKDIVRPLPYIV